MKADVKSKCDDNKLKSYTNITGKSPHTKYMVTPQNLLLTWPAAERILEMEL